MITTTLVLMTVLVTTDATADDEEKISPPLKPLSEELLLFLAEMEEVEGQWVHPVDLTEVDMEIQENVQSGQVATIEGKQDEQN